MSDAGALRDRAHAVMGVSALEAKLADLVEAERAARSRAAQEDEVVNRAAGAVLSGAGVPADLGEQIVAARRTNEQVEAALAAIGSIRRQLNDTVGLLRHSGVDSGLDVLAAELAEIVAAGREVLADLDDDVVDPAQAIEQDQVGPWRAAVAVARRLTDLRAVQDEWLSSPFVVTVAVSTPPAVHGSTSSGRIERPEQWADVVALTRAARSGDQTRA